MGVLRRRPADLKIQWLASQPWWRDLDHHELSVLAAAGEHASLPAGRRFMSQDRHGYEAAVVVSGEVEIFRDGAAIARSGPGEVIGELSLLDDHPPRNADVRAATDVELLVFSITDFERVMREVDAVRQQVLEAAERHRG